MDNYREIELLRKPWNEGDILVNDRYTHCYAVFKKYKENDTFEAYFILDNKNAYFDATASVELYHLASAEERDGFSRACKSMLQNLLAMDQKAWKKTLCLVSGYQRLRENNNEK